MKAGEILEVLGDLSIGQWGLVTTAQASAHGVRRIELTRVAERGLVRRVRYGVYAMPGAVADHLEEIRAEWLATNPSLRPAQRREESDPIVVSHESAARVYGVGSVTAHRGVHLTSPRRLRPSVTTAMQPHQADLHPREFTWIDGLPVTSIRRTLEDLTQTWEQQHIHAATVDAIRLGLLPASDITRSSVLLDIVPELAPQAPLAGPSSGSRTPIRPRTAPSHTTTSSGSSSSDCSASKRAG